MAAFVLFMLAVAGGVVMADLEGWLLAIAAGLGLVAALFLVASVISTKRRRARRKQRRDLREGLEDQVAVPVFDRAARLR